MSDIKKWNINPEKGRKFNFESKLNKIASSSNQRFSMHVVKMYKKINAGVYTQEHFEEVLSAVKNINSNREHDKIKTTRNLSTSFKSSLEFSSMAARELAMDLLRIGGIELNDIPLEVEKSGNSIKIKTLDVNIFDKRDFKQAENFEAQREKLMEKNIFSSIAIAAIATGIYNPNKDKPRVKIDPKDIVENTFQDTKILFGKHASFDKSEMFDFLMKERMTKNNKLMLGVIGKKVVMKENNVIQLKKPVKNEPFSVKNKLSGLLKRM